MEGVTLFLLLIIPKLLFTPPFYVLFNFTLRKLQKDTPIDAHLLMLVPLLLIIFRGMMDDEIMCWSWASMLRTLIRRTSSVVVLEHSSY